MSHLALPILHGNTAGPFWTAWRLDPVLTVALLAICALYVLALPRAGWMANHRSKAIAFGCGMATLVIALLGPLDTFNDDLFVLHMTQHVMLMLVAAPLVIAGGALILLDVRWGSHLPLVRRLIRWLAQPVPALLLFNLNLLAWHWPPLYDAALRREPVHILEHLLFFGTALLFWSGIITPDRDPANAASHAAIALLFITGSIGDLIGLTLLLANHPLYPFYETAVNPWGLSPLADQQLSGLVMLVSGAAVTFGGVFWIIARSVPRDEWVMGDG
jgi:cytochrome c oxidase assembly factor CtaG